MFNEGSDRNSSIQYIDLGKNKEAQEKFYKNLSRALQKMPKGRKNATLTEMINKRVVAIGFGSQDLKNPNAVVYGVNFWRENKFQLCIADVLKLADPIVKSDIIQAVKRISIAQKEIEDLNTRLTDYGPSKIDNLKKEIETEFDTVLNSIDYLGLLDVYYHYYCKYLASRTLLKNSKKVYEEYITLYEKALVDVIDKYGDLNNRQLLTIIVTYCIVKQFTDDEQNKIVKAIERTFGSQQENVDLFKALKPSQYRNGLDDIAYILTNAKLINITPGALNDKLKVKLGTYYLDFQNNIDDSLAYICSVSHQTEHFGQKINTPNNVEQLVLNAKGSTTLEAFSKLRN